MSGKNYYTENVKRAQAHWMLDTEHNDVRPNDWEDMEPLPLSTNVHILEDVCRRGAVGYWVSDGGSWRFVTEDGEHVNEPQSFHRNTFIDITEPGLESHIQRFTTEPDTEEGEHVTKVDTLNQAVLAAIDLVMNDYVLD